MAPHHISHISFQGLNRTSRRVPREKPTRDHLLRLALREEDHRMITPESLAMQDRSYLLQPLIQRKTCTERRRPQRFSMPPRRPPQAR